MQRRHQIYSTAYSAATAKLLGYAPHGARIVNPKQVAEGEKAACSRCDDKGCPDTLEKVILTLPATDGQPYPQSMIAHKVVVEKHTTLLKAAKPKTQNARITIEVPASYGNLESFQIFLEFCYTGNITIDVMPRPPPEDEGKNKDKKQQKREDSPVAVSISVESKVGSTNYAYFGDAKGEKTIDPKLTEGNAASKTRKKDEDDGTYEICIKAYGMAQKLGCVPLTNLCVDHSIDNYVKRAAGGLAVPRPGDVKLAWGVTSEGCMLRRLFVNMWALPEAKGLAKKYEEHLPAGFVEKVVGLIDPQPVCEEAKGSFHEDVTVEDGFDLVLR